MNHKAAQMEHGLCPLSLYAKVLTFCTYMIAGPSPPASCCHQMYHGTVFSGAELRCARGCDLSHYLPRKGVY